MPSAAFYLFALSVLFLPNAHALPQRIVSLAPVATEFLFALGVGDKVVGVTTYCDRPLAAQSIAKIGGFADPQLEAIIKLHPDLVVATSFGRAKNVVEQLRSRGVRTLDMPVDSLHDMKRFLSTLGKEIGQSEKSHLLQQNFDTGFALLRNSIDRTRSSPPRVLLLVSSSPLIGAAPSTFLGEVLTHVGAKNVVAAHEPSWPVLSLEHLMQHPPDIVVVTEGSKMVENARAALKPLILNHQNRIRIFAPKQPLMQRPGPYMLDDVQALINGLRYSNG